MSNLTSVAHQEGRGEAGGVAVPVGGTPDRPLQAEGAPRSLGGGKRLVEGVRPAQLIPRNQANQVRLYREVTHLRGEGGRKINKYIVILSSLFSK